VNSLISVCGQQIRVCGRALHIARLDADKYYYIDDPLPILKALSSCRPRVDIFTFMQRVTEPVPRFTYPMEWDNLAVLRISSFEEWWTKQIGFKARSKAKQPERKGVDIREVPFDNELVKGIWQVYNECPVRQGKRFHHYGKSLETVYKEEATFLDSSIFIGAFLGPQLIGFAKLVHDDRMTQAGLMNIVAMVKHRGTSATNGLIAHSVKSCAQRGILHLVYSRFTESRTSQSGLRDFKERNGFSELKLPRYYIPLSGRGSLGLRLGLHHQISDQIPKSLISYLTCIRAAWYDGQSNRKRKQSDSCQDC
jgi:hypothetical protein